MTVLAEMEGLKRHSGCWLHSDVSIKRNEACREAAAGDDPVGTYPIVDDFWGKYTPPCRPLAFWLFLNMLEVLALVCACAGDASSSALLFASESIAAWVQMAVYFGGPVLDKIVPRRTFFATWQASLVTVSVAAYFLAPSPRTVCARISSLFFMSCLNCSVIIGILTASGVSVSKRGKGKTEPLLKT